MTQHNRAAAGWALAAAGIALALAISYGTLVPTATWNAAALFSAIGFANLIAVPVGRAMVRTVLLSAALSASVAMGVVTASVGLVLLASAGCAFMALRSATSGTLAGRAWPAAGIGAAIGLAALVAVWVAPRILIR